MEGEFAYLYGALVIAACIFIMLLTYFVICIVLMIVDRGEEEK